MLRRLAGFFNPEMAIGFLIASAFWACVLGWQAAHAPTEMEKQKCYEAAEKAGQKADECKSLWEKTTTDPVAFFTLWLMIFTGGLTVSTVLLWLAGEKQIEFLRVSSEAQSRDMQESIKVSRDAAKAAAEAAYSERAWVTPDGFDTATISNIYVDGVHYPEGLGVVAKWKNTGRSPAIRLILFTTTMVLPRDAPMPTFDTEVLNPDDGRGILGPTNTGAGQLIHICGDDLTNFKERKVNWFVYSRATYCTVFEPDVRRVSEVCVVAEWNGDIRQPDGSYWPRMSYSATGPQNGAN